MRVQGSNSAALPSAPAAARRGASGAFSLGGLDASQTQNPVATLRTVGGIDALVALQGVADPAERRRRAAKSGRNALDALDALKVGLIGGELDASAINRLKVVADDLKDESGDPGLDAVLAEIGLRVEVEIAKMTPRQALAAS
jgi:hypothetical protein